jgi:hypothetical protein
MTRFGHCRSARPTGGKGEYLAAGFFNMALLLDFHGAMLGKCP